MRNIVKKSLFTVLGCLLANTMLAQSPTPIADLNFEITSSTTSTPANYVYSSSNTPSIKTQNSIKCIIVSDGGGSTAPTFNGTDAPSGGKRWMAFCPDTDCSVTIGIMSNKKKFFIQNADGEFFSYTNTANAVEEQTVTGLKAGKWYAMCGGSSQVYITKMAFTAAAPVLSDDATLSAIVYGSDQTSVPDFSSSQLSYDVELPATYVGGAPSVQVTTTHSGATPDITQATTLPGTATIVVTAEDGTTTKTYTVTFSRASTAPKVLTATWDNIVGTATVDNVNMTITGQVKYGTGLTAITPTFTGKNIASWTPSAPQDFSNGAVDYLFSSSTSESEQYAVTITEAPNVSTDATLSSLTYGGRSVPNFSAETYGYSIELAAGTSSAPQVAATANESHATVSVTQASSVPGSATVLVTAEDGTTQKTYTVNFTVPVPVSGLTTHEPGKYEEDELAGGYNTPLVVFNAREYEVYYLNRDKDDNLTVSTTNVDKAPEITTPIDKQKTKAADGWFTITTTTNSGGDSNAAKKDEFEVSLRSVSMKDKDEIELQVQGYDQFSFYGKDNNSSGDKFFHVYIDDVPQTGVTPEAQYKIRRYNMTSGKHVIKIAIKSGITSSSKFNSFSLRVAEEPRTKYVDGNDSTQEVLQTTAPKPVYYFTKYNSKGETRLIWEGPEATGVTLPIVGTGSVGDTLALSGFANCPVGTYHYFIKTYYNGLETSSVPGKFKVTSLIKAKGATKCDAYQSESIDDIRFTYYALSPNDIKITWKDGNAPAGINGSGSNGTYVISGTPSQTGTYIYTVSVKDGNSISDTIFVNPLDLGNNPILYLYKNDYAYKRDGMFEYLTSLSGGNLNLVARKAREKGKREASQYAKYKWILISEDVDANNPEVMAVARGESYLPVLSMKAFSYAPGRLDWGDPDNGSLTDEGRFLTVQRDDHPIFQAIGRKRGERLMVLDSVVGKGLMPIDVNYSGTLCLATALTRSIDDYYADGPEQTFLHEIPAEKHLGKKYICLPIGMEGSHYMSRDGKRLVDECIRYITGTQASIALPKLAITEFKIGDYAGKINDEENLITIYVQQEDSDMIKAVVPHIALESPMTFTYPLQEVAEDGKVDFSDLMLGVRYVVSDYINKRYYDVIVTFEEPQGIGEIKAGEWINIFDIYGRKVTTTNEDFRTMDLPHGMYIIVSESGKTIKTMR